MYSPSVKCLEDSLQIINVSAEIQTITTSIKIPEVDIQFNIRYRVSPYLSSYDDQLVLDVANITTKRISISDPDFVNPIPQITIVLDERTWPIDVLNPTLPVSSFSINMKEFSDVYTNTIGVDVIEIYYNFDQGIIGFRDKTTETLYGFERFE
jgi:hypothetical protein